MIYEHPLMVVLTDGFVRRRVASMMHLLVSGKNPGVRISPDTLGLEDTAGGIQNDGGRNAEETIRGLSRNFTAVTFIAAVSERV